MSHIPIKTAAEIESLRKGGKILAQTLEEVCKRAKPGVSTKELDTFAEEFIKSKGGLPGFKGYEGFPATLCTAINEVIVHGIPREDEFLQEGDLFTVDCGVILNGLYTDAARSITVGETAPPLRKKLIQTAKKAFNAAMTKARPRNRVSEMSKIIQKTVEAEGFHVIYDLTGHGIGKDLHEDPMVLNYYDGNPGPKLKAGMVMAVEPIFSAGTNHMRTLADGWTLATKDGSDSVQYENTILITQNAPELLTKL